MRLPLLPFKPAMKSYTQRHMPSSTIRNLTSGNNPPILGQHVKVVEVGPRDGLQNEKKFVPTDTKVQLINRLAHEAKLSHIEVTAFVSASKVPQMQDSTHVLQKITRHPNVTYSVLTPNATGLANAIKAKVDQVAVFGSASEAFSLRNINCSIAESFDRFSKVVEDANLNNVPVRAYLSCVLGCPFEGDVAPQKVAYLASRFLAMGCHEVSLGDTIGVGTPGSMARMLDHVLQKCPVDMIAVHCHDTYGQALANIVVALGKGVRVIDASVSGLGGCPYAPGASGNVPTEDVVYMLQGMGYSTSVDLHNLVQIGNWISAQLGRTNGSKVGLAMAKHHANPSKL